MTEMEVWEHQECVLRLLVKWIDGLVGLKWLENDMLSKPIIVTRQELESIGWEKVSHKMVDLDSTSQMA